MIPTVFVMPNVLLNSAFCDGAVKVEYFFAQMKCFELFEFCFIGSWCLDVLALSATSMLQVDMSWPVWMWTSCSLWVWHRWDLPMNSNVSCPVNTTRWRTWMFELCETILFLHILLISVKLFATKCPIKWLSSSIICELQWLKWCKIISLKFKY